jgi:hypothetical protein
VVLLFFQLVSHTCHGTPRFIGTLFAGDVVPPDAATDFQETLPQDVRSMPEPPEPPEPPAHESPHVHADVKRDAYQKRKNEIPGVNENTITSKTSSPSIPPTGAAKPSQPAQDANGLSEDQKKQKAAILAELVTAEKAGKWEGLWLYDGICICGFPLVLDCRFFHSSRFRL